MKKVLILLTVFLYVMVFGPSVLACVPEYNHPQPDYYNDSDGCRGYNPGGTVPFFTLCGITKKSYWNIYWYDSQHNLTASRTPFVTIGTGQRLAVPIFGTIANCYPEFYGETTPDGGEAGTGSFEQRVISRAFYGFDANENPVCALSEDHYFSVVDNCFSSNNGGGDDGGGGGDPICNIEIIPTCYWDDCAHYDDLYGEFCVGGYDCWDEVWEICW